MHAAARRVGLSALALGVLLAGAEPEEALTAGIASGRGHPQLAAGDAIGANFVVLTLALGLAGVLTALPVSRRVREYGGVAALAGAVALVVLLDGRVGRVEAAVLVLAYLLAVAWVWRRERRPPAFGEVAEEEGTGAEEPGPPSALAVAGVLGGLALMLGGGWLAVTGARRIVVGLGLGDTGVGLTLLALATSAEMLALVLAAARHRVVEVALAGLLGAVIYNATVSLGVGALVAPLRGVGEPRLLAVAAACVLLPLTPFVFGRLEQRQRPGRFGRASGSGGGRGAGRWAGVLLVAAYLVAVPLLLA